jgi:hypothetical protein
MRLDNIKRQYQHELVPLTQQREALARDIAELKTAREQVLGETTVLNARNEVLAQLSAQYSGRMEGTRSETPTLDIHPPQEDSALRKKSTSFDRSRSQLEPPPLLQSSLSTGSAQSTLSLVEDRDTKFIRAPKHELTDGMSTLKHGKFKWPGSRARDQSLNPSDYKAKGHLEHNFQPASVLRFTRCDHCGDKLWGGSQYRCTSELPLAKTVAGSLICYSACHVNVHSRCVNQVNVACSQHPSRPREDVNGHIVQARTSGASTDGDLSLILE